MRVDNTAGTRLNYPMAFDMSALSRSWPEIVGQVGDKLFGCRPNTSDSVH